MYFFSKKYKRVLVFLRKLKKLIFRTHLYACNGILFNHESPRRGETFVTRKISRAISRIKLGFQDCLYLGNLDAKRDWGHAKEYVKAMWMMLQQEKPDDYVIGTGKCHSVREFLEVAFNYLDLDPYEYLEIDETFYRPSEVMLLQANASKAKKILGWSNTISFEALIKQMVDNDLNLYKSGNIRIK